MGSQATASPPACLMRAGAPGAPGAGRKRARRCGAGGGPRDPGLPHRHAQGVVRQHRPERARPLPLCPVPRPLPLLPPAPRLAEVPACTWGPGLLRQTGAPASTVHARLMPSARCRAGRHDHVQELWDAAAAGRAGGHGCHPQPCQSGTHDPAMRMLRISLVCCLPHVRRSMHNFPTRHRLHCERCHAKCKMWSSRCSDRKTVCAHARPRRPESVDSTLHARSSRLS